MQEAVLAADWLSSSQTLFLLQLQQLWRLGAAQSQQNLRGCKFCSRCSKINSAIYSAPSAASPVNEMQGMPPPPLTEPRCCLGSPCVALIGKAAIASALVTHFFSISNNMWEANMDPKSRCQQELTTCF